LGYDETCCLTPERPTPWLSQDILHEPRLLDALLDYAGEGQTLQLVPYATTPQFMQLVETLRTRHGLTVHLPESPEPDALWVRDYIDTKTGWRVVAGRALPNADELLPQGFAFPSADLAAAAAHWFGQNSRACLVKSDIGENGIGNVVIRPGEYPSAGAIHNLIKRNPFLQDDWITVEAMIDAKVTVSPSFEAYVPPLGKGEPFLTYVSDQVFQDFGDFCGVLVSRELCETPWYAPLVDAGLRVAREMQAMGYVGLFDLDAIVDDNGRVYLLEVNARRTGGTHVHDFAYVQFGADYLDHVAILSHDTMPSGEIADVETLLRVIGDLAYPVAGAQRGVLVNGTSALVAREYGCLIVGRDRTDVLDMQRQLNERVAAYSKQSILTH
jgi:hypothetical protein